MFQEPSVGLFLLVNVNALNKAVEEFLFFCVIESVVKLVKVQEELIDVILGNPVLTDVNNSGFRFVDLLFNRINFVVELTKAVFHVLILAVIILVRYIKTVHLLSQFGFCAVQLAKLLVKLRQLRFKLLGVYLSADFLTDCIFKFRVVDQLADNLCNCVIDHFLFPLPFISAFVTVHGGAVLALIVIIIFVIGSVFSLFSVHIAVHSRTADRATQNAR